MPWDAQGRWIPEEDSVAKQLTGLIASDSKYIATARAAGQRTAHKRGLMNSSIAAGAAENAAIAAAAPIASQDAAQIAQKNQAVLEGGISLDNSTKLQAQQQAGQIELQKIQDNAALERAKLSESGATARQLAEFDARTKEQERSIVAAEQQQQNQIASAERQAALSADTSLRQTQIQANSNLTGNYLQAFASIAQNENIPAASRNAYIAEFQRILAQGQALVGVVKTIPLDWGGTAPPPVPGPPIAENRGGGLMANL